MANFLGKMFSMFKYVPSKNPETAPEPVMPAYYNQKTKRLEPIKFSPELRRLYDLYMQDCMDSRESFKNREDRYNDLEYAYRNNAIFSSAINLYANESVQADAQSDYIKVFARDKRVEKYIGDFFSRIGIDRSKIRDLALGLAKLGDHFWVNSVDPKLGITEITPVDPYQVLNRIEFNAAKSVPEELRKAMMSTGSNSILKKLVDEMMSAKSGGQYSNWFKSYLFGYELEGGVVVPPWGVTHFKLYSTDSEFFPFGKPILIHAISPYRQLQSAKNLIAMARASNFPIKHFQITTTGSMSASEQWEQVVEAYEEFKNLGKDFTFKESFATDGEIWSPKDLLTLDVHDPQIDLSNIADIEMLEDNLIMATQIPKGYLIADKGGFGLSGQSLLQQSKIFGRTVFVIQTAILEQLTNLVRIQFAITDDYPVDTDFELSMNFPVLEHTSEQIRQKSDVLSLVADTLEKLASTMGVTVGEMPTSIIRDVYTQLSFFDTEDINDWLMTLSKIKKKKMDAGQMGGAEMGMGAPGGMDMGGFGGAGGVSAGASIGGLPGSFEGAAPPEIGGDTGENALFGADANEAPVQSGMSTAAMEAIEKINKRYNSALIRESYFEAKEERQLREYADPIRQSHIYSSCIMDPYTRKILTLLSKTGKADDSKLLEGFELPKKKKRGKNDEDRVLID